MKNTDPRPTLCVAATFTAEPLQEPLDFWWRELGQGVELHLAPYGQLFQQLLDPGGVLRDNRSGANVLLMRWEDLAGSGRQGAPGVPPGSDGRLAGLSRELAEAVEAARLTVPTLIVVCPPRERSTASREALSELRQRLDSSPGVSILGPGELDRLYPVDSPHDEVTDRFGHVPYTPLWFSAAGTAIARWYRLATARARKVVVLDCDNTLWGGVVGEDGPEGLRVDGHWESLQRFMVRQSESGRLLCLCSKNEEADVLGVFDQRAEMPLQRHHVAAHRIGWGPKPQAVQELAHELNLGLDSFVFVDDSPVECAEMRAACPQVVTLQLPPDPARIASFLEHAWPLDVGRVTNDDRQRARSYADNARRAELRRAAPTLESFLEGLDLQVDLGPATPTDLPRLAQLTQRTNQFNASTVRLSEAELTERLDHDLPYSLVVKASDRFGDYGTVGLALARPESRGLRVEVLLLSCRVLGRGIEHRLLARLGELAYSAGLDDVEVVFRASPRNTPVRLFLERECGSPATEAGETIFRVPAAAARRVVYRPDSETSEEAAAGGGRASGAPDAEEQALSDTFQRIADELTTASAVAGALAARVRPREDIEQAFVAPAAGLETRIADVWSEVLRVGPVGARDGFRELGGRSVDLVRIHRLLLDRLQVDLDITTLFQHPTVASLAARIEMAAAPSPGSDPERGRRIRSAVLRRSGTPGKAGGESGMSDPNQAPEGVAVVGMSGRFPGARDVDSFWENIRGGVESVSRFSEDELEVPPPGPASGDEGSVYVPAKGVLQDVDLFDARFFGYLPREAELMDPQHRVFLELAWEALEDAGCDAERYPGAIGVYGGCYIDTYLLSNLCTSPGFLQRLVDSIQVGSLQTELGNDKDYLATRVSFKLGLRGPAVTVQSACSTSLVSIALASQSLLAGQCDMALAGGATITFPQKKGYFYKEGGMLSSDGHCRPFDENAQGTVFSNGAAIVVLKRLSDALADGNTIHSVIIGNAINNDGGQKVSYTAPSVDGQAEVIALALDVADVSARSIGYIEAHGTATPLGDPIEIAGLTKAFRKTTDEVGYCAIGSAKSNLGHLDVASGAVGVIKTSLALRDKVLPPSLHFERPNPKIDFARTPFYVNAKLQPWEANGDPRRAGVSSFGVGGTNVHLVLQEPPEPAATATGRDFELLTLSARTESALATQSTLLAEHLQAKPEADLADVAFTLQAGRRAFSHRRIVVCGGTEDAVRRLESEPSPADVGRPEAASPSLVFLFPGQGAQYPGMARGLYQSEPVVRETVDEATRLLERDLGLDLRALLHPASGHEDEAARKLAETQFSQPALLTVEVALGRLLASWGLHPAFVMGHSVGEFAAACLAEVFDFETALRLVAARGRLMQSQEPGRMLAVRAPAGDVEPLLPDEIALAAINGPELCVVSGPVPAIEAFERDLAGRDLSHSTLRTSHAFHSAMMEPAVAPLVEEVSRATLRRPTVPIVSTALGRVLEPDEATDPAYWGGQLRKTVRFAEAVELVAAEPERLFVEVGPGQTLTTLTRQTTRPLGKRTVVPCLGPLRSPGHDVEQILGAVGRLWVSGANVEFERLARRPRRRVPLPTYPFERKRFWVEPTRLRPSAPGESTTTGGANGDSPLPAPAPAKEAPPDEVARTEALLRRQIQLMAEQLSLLGGKD